MVLEKLFAGRDAVRLEPSHHALIGGAVEALRDHLRGRMEKVNLLANARYLTPGLLISLATVVRCGFAVQGGQGMVVLLAATGLLLWSMGWLTVTALAMGEWKDALSGPYHAPTARRRAMITTAVSLPFLLGEVAGLAVMVRAASMGVGAALALMVAIIYVFHCLLKSPTRAGRVLANQIDNFRLFLSAPDQEPRDRPAARPTTDHPFERLLPYAMALNVEKAWGEKVAAALAPTAKGKPRTYSPVWYASPGFNPITLAAFALALGNSLSRAISSSLTAPGSSSRRR
jgi:hypothetical protein